MSNPQVKVFSIVVASLLSATISFAGPFGFEKGQTYTELSKLGLKPFGSSSNQVYMVAKVPKPHKDIDLYTIEIGKTVGLCKIIASTGVFSTNIFGTQLKEKFNILENSLIKKYGKDNRERSDFLMSGSIWDKPEDWMMGLLKKERELSVCWFPKEGVTTLSGNITSVCLLANPISREKGSIILEYEFDNVHQCMQERESESLDNL